MDFRTKFSFKAATAILIITFPILSMANDYYKELDKHKPESFKAKAKQVVYEKTDVLFLSDIDDTVKITHVASKMDSIKNAFKTEHRFKYMTHLYNHIVNQFNSVQTFYVTHSPDWLEKPISELLLKGQFPQGQLITRDDLKDEEYKLRVIDEILKKTEPKIVFFFGDNASNDAKFYYQLSQKYTNTTFFTFIRTAYTDKEKGSKLYPGQSSFVTPLEVVLELSKNFHFYYNDKFITDLSTAIAQNKWTGKKDKPEIVPKWIHCNYLKWNWISKSKKYKELETAATRIKDRCHI